MYSGVSRGLFIVGRQLRQKLCENTSIATGAAGCALTAAIHRAPSSNVLRRSYCNKDDEELSITPPTLLSPNEEAEIKLKDLLAVPEKARLKKIIELEIEIMQQNDHRVPREIRPRDWYELLNLNGRSKRSDYLQFVWKIEKKRENFKKKKVEKSQQRADDKAIQSEEEYRLGHNTMFMRIYESTINHMYHSRLISSMMFGQQLVLDCSYEKYMTKKELQYCAKQIQISFGANRVHDDPFDLYLCNANLQGNLMKNFHRFIPTVYNDDFPLNIKTESYLDIFDKKNLVYLTPHCTQEMTEFDHDAVYIIGAFVDKSCNEPLSLAKAKKEGLKMLTFPLNRYLQWGSSSGKNLTLNQVLSILLDLRLTGSWDEALKHVPRRKLIGYRNYQIERNKKYLRRRFNTEMDNTSPLPEPKLNEKFAYEAERSYSPNVNQVYRISSNAATTQDFSMKARENLRNKWKN